MRVLIDYRAALLEPTGVGEFTHQLARALLASARSNGLTRELELTLFSSSWKDRFVPSSDLAGAVAIDRRVPVTVLNFLWHRCRWPAAETLARGSFDVAHSLHPLLLPARDAAQVVTICDLNFLVHPERTRAEIRRDYPALARAHARRADRVIVISAFTAREVETRLGVPPDRISICRPGAPSWQPRAQQRGDYLLCLGTLEPRKNVGLLLDAYERLVAKRADLPPLRLVGKATAGADDWLRRIGRAPLQGRVQHVGYVAPAHRRQLYEHAALLIQPSYEEGFGLPVLEAMTIGVPVIATNRGALPEVVGDAGPLVEPDEPDQLASAIEHLIDDESATRVAVGRGLDRARRFSWEQTARDVMAAYRQAMDHRREASRTRN